MIAIQTIQLKCYYLSFLIFLFSDFLGPTYFWTKCQSSVPGSPYRPLGLVLTPLKFWFISPQLIPTKHNINKTRGLWLALKLVRFLHQKLPVSSTTSEILTQRKRGFLTPQYSFHKSETLIMGTLGYNWANHLLIRIQKYQSSVFQNLYCELTNFN